MDHRNTEDAEGHFLTVCCHRSVLDFWNLKPKWMQIKNQALQIKDLRSRFLTLALTESLENTCLIILGRKDYWQTGETKKSIKKDLKPHTDRTPPLILCDWSFLDCMLTRRTAPGIWLPLWLQPQHLLAVLHSLEPDWWRVTKPESSNHCTAIKVAGTIRQLTHSWPAFECVHIIPLVQLLNLW